MAARCGDRAAGSAICSSMMFPAFPPASILRRKVLLRRKTVKEGGCGSARGDGPTLPAIVRRDHCFGTEAPEGGFRQAALCESPLQATTDPAAMSPHPEQT